MSKFYTDEKNAQILIALLKEHGVKKIIASPGGTNIALVASMQNDPYFEMYSAVDERGAAYLACGMAAESLEPVVICCTGATASRNYLPGLTEAFYRKLPILAITASQDINRTGHHIAQLTDRSVVQKDVANLSVTLPIANSSDDIWECEVKINEAILELSHNGGGPVHINIPTVYNKSFETKSLPSVRKINRFTPEDELPPLPKGKIAIFMGSHLEMSDAEIEAIDNFCSSNNALVFCDHTSNYNGKYKVLFALAACQDGFDRPSHRPDLVIHIGEISGDYYSLSNVAKHVWRVNKDGALRDTFKKLKNIFQMSETAFFKAYSDLNKGPDNTYYNSALNHVEALRKKLPELDFSNIYAASKMSAHLPENASLHFGILNSLRSWNFFNIPDSVRAASNVGGFGTDGGVSSLLGAALVNPEKTYIGILGDLTFFYDMNAIGSRHLPKNLRIVLVNNGNGTEFKRPNHLTTQFGDDTEKYISAGGHFGNKSPNLVRNYANDLGFEYFSASNKTEFEKVYKKFLISEKTEKPLFFEIFTDNEGERQALKALTAIDTNIKGKAKQAVKQALGQGGFNMIKKAIKK